MAIAAIRFNNPGNVSLPIQGWKGGGSIVGISGQPGYASFPDANTGYAAFQQRVNNYIGVKGLTTIRQLNTKYAEHGAWGAGVAANSGIGIDEPLDLNNQSQMSSLYGGILKQETGKTAAGLGVTDTSGTLPFDGYVSVDNQTGAVADGKKGEESYPWSPTSVPGLKEAPNSSNLTKATDAQTAQQAITGSQLADALVAAAGQQAGTEAATTQATLQTAGGWLSQTQGWLSNWIVRAFIVFLGLVLIGGALGLLIWKGNDALPSIVTK